MQASAKRLHLRRVLPHEGQVLFPGGEEPSFFFHFPGAAESVRRPPLFLVQLAELPLLFRQTGGIHPVLPFQQGTQIPRCVESVLVGSGLSCLREGGAFLREDTAAIVSHMGTGGENLAALLPGQFEQLELEALEDPGAENPPEDLPSRFAVGQQQTEEFPLREHTELFELGVIEPQQGGDFGGDLCGLGYGPPVRQEELRLRRLMDQPFPPFFGTALFGPAGNGIDLPPVGEGERDLRAGFRRGEIAAQAAVFAVFPAGFPKQRIGNAVEQGGFARSRVPGDEKQAGRAERCKVDRAEARVRTERGQFQPQRLHRFRPLSFMNTRQPLPCLYPKSILLDCLRFYGILNVLYTILCELAVL